MTGTYHRVLEDNAELSSRIRSPGSANPTLKQFKIESGHSIDNLKQTPGGETNGAEPPDRWLRNISKKPAAPQILDDGDAFSSTAGEQNTGVKIAM